MHHPRGFVPIFGVYLLGVCLWPGFFTSGRALAGPAAPKVLTAQPKVRSTAPRIRKARVTNTTTTTTTTSSTSTSSTTSTTSPTSTTSTTSTTTSTTNPTSTTTSTTTTTTVVAGGGSELLPFLKTGTELSQPALDVLFVIDNSVSMKTKQDTLDQMSSFLSTYVPSADPSGSVRNAQFAAITTDTYMACVPRPGKTCATTFAYPQAYATLATGFHDGTAPAIKSGDMTPETTTGDISCFDPISYEAETSGVCAAGGNLEARLRFPSKRAKRGPLDWLFEAALPRAYAWGCQGGYTIPAGATCPIRATTPVRASASSTLLKTVTSSSLALNALQRTQLSGDWGIISKPGLYGHMYESGMASSVKFIDVNEGSGSIKLFRAGTARTIVFISDTDDNCDPDVGDNKGTPSYADAMTVGKNSRCPRGRLYNCSGLGYPSPCSAPTIGVNDRATLTKKAYDNFFRGLDGSGVTGDPKYLVAAYTYPSGNSLRDPSGNKTRLSEKYSTLTDAVVADTNSFQLGGKSYTSDYSTGDTAAIQGLFAKLGILLQVTASIKHEVSLSSAYSARTVRSVEVVDINSNPLGDLIHAVAGSEYLDVPGGTRKVKFKSIAFLQADGTARTYPSTARIRVTYN